VSSDPLAPGLLVAMPQLVDPNFHRGVVLIVHHDEEGSFGVVVNRTAPISTDRLCRSIGIEWRGDPDQSVHWGGPVQPEMGWVLFDELEGEEKGEDVQQLCTGLYFAGSLDVLRRVANEPPPRMRVMLGYAGWGPGQLEEELAASAWLVVPLDHEALFEVAPADLWEHAVRSLGVEPATLVTGQGVH